LVLGESHPHRSGAGYEPFWFIPGRIPPLPFWFAVKMFQSKLRREFYRRKPQIVAKELLGKWLTRNIEGKFIIAKIVETEAYGGTEDKGCHASRYGLRKKTAGLFGEVGYAYIYPVHINMFCFNAVAHEDGEAGGVLIRAGEPLEGIEIILQNLNTSSKNDTVDFSDSVTLNAVKGLRKAYDITKLLNGPAKLCKALKINGSLNGEDLLGDNLFIMEGEEVNEKDIVATKRINIPYAEEAKDYLRRYAIRNSPYLSRPLKI